MSMDNLLGWLSEAATPVLAEQEAIDAYIGMHPKTVFFKTLQPHAVVLDMGRADAGLVSLRRWLGFQRCDVRIVGAAFNRQPGADGEAFDAFIQAMSIEELDQKMADLPLKINAVIASRIIECVDEPEKMIGSLTRLLPKGGRLYVEWPSPHTKLLPRLIDIQNCGYPVSTVNFYDDAEHKYTYSLDWLKKHCQNHGLRYEQGGELAMPFLADELRNLGVIAKSTFLLSSAIWLKTRYLSFASFEKIE